MKQKNLISFFRDPNKNNIYIVLNLLKRKLKKLFIQNPFFLTNVQFFIYRKSFFLIADNVGSLYKILLFLQNIDKKNISFSHKMRKKQIINRVGVFKNDVSEEKNLIQEESKPRIFKKLGRRYKALDLEFNLSNYAKSFDLDFKKSMYKNQLHLRSILPNRNILTNIFSYNIIIYYFKNYRSFIKNSLCFFVSKNFFLLCLIYNYVSLNLKIIYFYFQLCQLSIK